MWGTGRVEAIRGSRSRSGRVWTPSRGRLGAAARSKSLGSVVAMHPRGVGSSWDTWSCGEDLGSFYLYPEKTRPQRGSLHSSQVRCPSFSGRRRSGRQFTSETPADACRFADRGGRSRLILTGRLVRRLVTFVLNESIRGRRQSMCS